jgi:hypothetical protein
MTKDDILSMAKEAGFPFNKFGCLCCDDENEIDADSMFERFAALVAEKEREDCATECERMMMYPGGRQESAAHQNVWEAAKAIRARGQK